MVTEQTVSWAVLQAFDASISVVCKALKGSGLAAQLFSSLSVRHQYVRP